MFQPIKNRAFSLLEVIVSVALFSIFASVILVSASGVPFALNNSEDRMVARYLALEAAEASRSIRDYDWDNLTAGTHGLSKASGYWEFSGSSDTFGDFTRSIVVTDLATFRKEVDVNISWTTDEGIAQSYDSTIRLTNWESLFFVLDTQADFDDGFYNSTESVAKGTVQQTEYLTSWSSHSTLVTQDISNSTGTTHIYMDGTFLYLTTSVNASAAEFFVFETYDLTDSSAITQLDSLELGQSTNDFLIHDGYAYLATLNTSGELIIVDLSDFTIEQTVDIEGTGVGAGVAVYNDDELIFTKASQTEEEIYILDISNPAGSITEINSVEIGATVSDVEVDGNYAFYAGYSDSGEIGVIRLTDYTSVNTVDMSGAQNANSIFVDDANDLAYIVRDVGLSGTSSLTEFDISSPESFTTSDINGTVNIVGNANEVYVHDGVAYVASDGSTSEVETVDLSSYSVTDTLDVGVSGNGETIWFQGAYIYLGPTGVNEDLLILESVAGGGWGTPSIVDSDDLPGIENGNSIYVDGDYLYVGRNNASGTCNTSTGDNCEFLIYDISTPTAISLTGALEIGGAVTDIVVSGDYAYIASNLNSAEFRVIDISTKSSPSITGSYNAEGASDGRGVEVSGDYAYLITNNNSGSCNTGTQSNCELYSLDISTKSSPSFADALNAGSSGRDLVINGTDLFAASIGNSNEIVAVDITTPTSISLTSAYNHPGNANANSLFYNTADDTLHVSFSANGASNGDYSILDVSNPASISRLDTLALNENNNGITVIDSEDLAFVVGARSSGQLTIVDISNTSSISESTTLNLTSTSNEATTDGTYVYVASEDDSQEVQVVGASGGGGSTEYTQLGIYTTEVFDSGGTGTSWGDLEWDHTLSGTVQFRTRTASSTANLELATWVGSDGTHDTYYTSSPSAIQIHSGSTGNRYLQVQAYIEHTGGSTPNLNQMSVSYSQ